MPNAKSPLLAALALAAATLSATAAPVINEIMFHPPGAPAENPAEEWIEIFNPDAAVVNIAGWKLSKGVAFTIPGGATLPAGGYLVVAADVAAFNAAHPGFSGTVIGGWTGRLSNSGEQVQLDNALGAKVCDVSYADQGDWALRGRGVLSFSHKGWDWFCEADGGGRTIELRNPALGIGSGQNWGVSTAAGGTPGAANTLASANVAPLIKDAKHRPQIPRSTDPITISCKIEDELPGATATLQWRLDGAGAFTAAAMTDTDGDGAVEAVIPAQANLAVIEWYISATDGTNVRTWPAAARTSDPGVLPETFAQATNALVQVDNAFDPATNFTLAGNQPIYRFIMTNAERLELAQIGSTSGQEQSEATMNGTFISHDGTGIKTVINAGFRNRGFGSALGPPNNFHVNFRNDDRWNGRSGIQINCQYPYAQVLGGALFAVAGIAPQNVACVQVRVNGANLAQSGALMYSRYARLEGRGGDWAEKHYPNDPDGNFYRLDDHAPGTAGVPAGNLGSGEFRYEGTDPAAYSDTYFKETNQDANDYSDLANLTKIISAPLTGGTTAQPAIADADYVAALGGVLDIDQVFRFFATDALVGNQEGGLQSGRGDDVSIYRGVLDPRFKFIPHDLDDVFDIGNGSGSPVTRSVFSYDFAFGTTNAGTGVLGLARLFNHPQLVPRYYAAVLEGLDTWFTSATIDPVIDQILIGWVPATNATAAPPNDSIADIKAYVAARRANVLAQIQQNYALAVSTAAADTAEGYKQTTTGAATFSGTFHVAKTYSITVNGVPATLNYRAGASAAGSWSLAVSAGGGGVLTPGLNRVVVNFWDAPNGTGKVLQALTADVFYNTGATTAVGGTLTAGSLRLTAPSSYVPGKPFLARVELLDSAGALNRAAWDTTVTLSSNVGGFTLPAVQLYNGSGSALVTAGGGGGAAPTVFYNYGTGGTGTTTVSGTGGSVWRTKTDFTSATLPTFIASFGATWKNEGFDDSAWVTRTTQTGYGDGDENQTFTRVDYDSAVTGTQSGPSYLFRNTFTITDVNALASVTGEVKYDDAYVVYVNGTEVARSSTLTAGAALTAYASAVSVDNATAALNIPLGLLHNGVNTIAVEIHQESTTSSDVTFDLKMQANFPSTDPGNFTLTAAGGGFSAQKALTSLGSAPTYTVATGTLATGTTTWSGLIRVTGDVTVPVGATLNIAAGTNVFVDGDATAGSTAGKRIIVNGAFSAQGTQANPVAISAFNAADRWGGFSFSSAQPSTFSYTLLNHAGHTTGVGHTSKGPMLRLATSNVSLLDSVLADGPAKAIYTSGTCDLVIQRSLIERMITGPEIEDGASLLCEDSNIQRILPDYRESNDALSNDEDCLYVHNAPGRSVVVRRSVFARCGDDVIDNLAGPIVVEDSILREGWDKGLSLLNNDLTISNTQIIHCDKGIAMKSQNANTRTVTATNVTIVSENHDSMIAPWGYTGGVNGGDPDTQSTGFYTQNKAGQSNTAAILAVNAKNCIIIAQQPVLIDSPYDPANTGVTYSDLGLLDYSTFAWAGTGNISADPLFADAANGNYRITANSPARDTGDPATFDPDSTRADMGALPFAAGGAAQTIVWTPAGGPYRVTADATIPAGTTLSIQAGTKVFFDQNKKLTINGTLTAIGTAAQHVVFSHVPGTVAAGDADPIVPGVQTGPPKWGGIVIVGPTTGPAITGHEFRYCDFINAQPAVAAGNTGSLGIIRAGALIDHCIFLGTHLRQVYGENCSLQVQFTTFVDPFNPADANDNPVAYSLDNMAEPLKVANANFPSNPNYTNGMPNGGHFRVWFNDFYGNKGHNDVFDADAGVLGSSAILDCRYNHFHGLTGDEHIDLGGDAYIASNIFERGAKDVWTNDHGYSNCISSGDKGSGTTIWVVRNTAFDVDHMINCKVGTAAIFEHNTVANFHADFTYTSTPPVSPFTQDVRCSAVNLFVPDDVAPQAGFGAYIGYNLFHNMPRIVSWADLPGGTTSKLEATNNYLSNVTDNSVGPVTGTYSGGTQHPGGFTSLGSYTAAGDPRFVNEAGKNYALRAHSPARGAAAGGIDFGASVAEWACLLGGPSGTTAATGASFTVGGPGMVAYKWRLDGGAWSAPATIGTGLAFPRTATPAVRQATLTLSGLGSGTHMLEVLGQDPAGNWQDADPARTAAGLAQAAPTARSWTVDPAFTAVRLSEILADSATLADTVELQNLSGLAVNLAGWSLTDDPLLPNKVALTGTIADGAYAAFTSATLGLDRDGDAVYLYQGGVLRDSVVFGQQVQDKTIGRNVTGAWVLCTPTLGAANAPVPTGDFSTVRISEWLASGAVLYSSDWIELQNTGANPAALAGLRVTDNRAGNASAYTFPALSFIGAGGYVRLVADGATGPGHVPFSLDAEYETISLLALDGSLLDGVILYPQTTDYSMGRDGSGAFAFYELPTRGFLNGTGDPAYVNALALLRGLRIIEIMYNPPGGTEYEFVELRNVGAAAFDLTGVKFVNGIDFTFPATVLSPGQNVLVVKNTAKFRARYGNGALVAGAFTGSLDNSGEKLALQLPPPFDANVLTFTYGDTWHPSTDGPGRSLVVPNPLLAAILWGDRATWAASATNGGDPDGASIAALGLYADWAANFGVTGPAFDGDRDGIAALVEFGLGMNPASVEGGDGAAGAPQPAMNAGRMQLVFYAPANASATQLHGMPELTYTVLASGDLVTWSIIATKTFPTAWSGSATVTVGAAAGGFTPVTVEDTAGGAPRFLRLQVGWAQ